jgi:RNA polymerase sigma factor (sigma-70 family)
MGNTTDNTLRGRCGTRRTATVGGGATLTLDDIIDEYSRLVAAAARRVMGPRGDVEDVMQETWIVYLEAGHQILDQRCLGGWLFQVATRIAVRTQRKVSRYIPVDDVRATDQADTEVDIEGRVLRQQRRHAIDTAGDGLRDREQQLLDLLLDAEDLGYREIARRSGVPIGSLGPTRDRLIRKLRSAPEVQRLADERTRGKHALSCAA